MVSTLVGELVNGCMPVGVISAERPSFLPVLACAAQEEIGGHGYVTIAVTARQFRALGQTEEKKRELFRQFRKSVPPAGTGFFVYVW